MMAGNQGHKNDWVSTFPFYYQNAPHFTEAFDGFEKAGNTIIGNDVWIGSEAMIMSGIKVGDGAIIASRAVVTKDVEPYAVVGSNPAKHIRFRFSQLEITMLQEMQWWNWSDDVVKAAMPLLCSADISGLYQYWQQQIMS